MSAVFVTGTGTEVGKTFVTAALIRHFRMTGRAVEAIKPVVSGFDPSAAAASDPAILLAALGREANAEEIERIAPWRYRAPLSPDLAAACEGRSIDFSAVVDFSLQSASGQALTLIEGIGGIMVPLDGKHTVLDWVEELRAPTLLVTGSYLGTISHTLTALEVLRHRAVAVAAVVVSESAAPGAPLADTVSAIARFASPTEVIGLPRHAGADHATVARIAALL